MSETSTEIDRMVRVRAAAEFERQVAAGLSGPTTAGPAPTGEPQPATTELCKTAVGSRPWWMGVDQYDPCRCILPAGHDPELEHACEHTLSGTA